MFVELIYDKRNFEGLAGARETITAELTKRIHRIFPRCRRTCKADDDLAGDQYRCQ